MRSETPAVKDTELPAAPHALPLENLCAHLQVTLGKGLTEEMIPAIRARFGSNELTRVEEIKWWRKLLKHFNELVIWILIGAAVLSGVLGDWTDAIVILAVVILNGFVGFFQERKADQAFAALEKLSAPNAKVIRNGVPLVIPAKELVPGDEIELSEGDFIPADARLIEAFELRVQESSLTGESVPVEKDAKLVLDASASIGDRKNMVFAGTATTTGRATALVVATGMATQLGKIAGMLQQSALETTPLQQRINRLGKTLVLICLALIVVIFGIQILRGGDVLEVFLLAISMAVAAVPEGLPAVVTVALAIGVKRMAKEKALIRRLPSVETLGSVSVICSDKTGTLTRNQMMVRWVYAGGQLVQVTGNGYEPTGNFTEVLEENIDEVTASGGKPVVPTSNLDLMNALTVGVRCNHARLLRPKASTESWDISGDPTEGALLVAGLKAGVDAEEPGSQLLHEIPFESHRKFMSVLLRSSDKKLKHYSKGAIEVILPKCTQEGVKGSIVPIDDARRKEIIRVSTEFASRGLRVLALAYQEKKSPELTGTEAEMTFSGLVGIMDPPREEVKIAVATCYAAGIKPVMITGDHPSTAAAIAKELGITKDGDRIVSGIELDSISEEELVKQVGQIAVYARVSAEHKMKIVRAWKKSGVLVAMTGDGVNDAPAVQEADIGIAMGLTGTDVTKQASDLVLLDDNFSTIVVAVREGRGILDNITKVLHYLLAGNSGELLVMFGATLIGFPYPLLAAQILWINLVTDAFPALALSVEPVDDTVMQRRPRAVNAPILSSQRGVWIVLQGTLIACCVLVAFSISYQGNPERLVTARSVAFGTLAFSHILFAMTCRNYSRSVFSLGIFSNPWILAAVGISLILQFAVMVLPGVRDWFEVTTRLTQNEWMTILLFSVLPMIIIEVGKLLVSFVSHFRRRFL